MLMIEITLYVMCSFHEDDARVAFRIAEEMIATAQVESKQPSTEDEQYVAVQDNDYVMINFCIAAWHHK